jgi:hypothetical protein
MIRKPVIMLEIGGKVLQASRLGETFVLINVAVGLRDCLLTNIAIILLVILDIRAAYCRRKRSVIGCNLLYSVT